MGSESTNAGEKFLLVAIYREICEAAKLKQSIGLEAGNTLRIFADYMNDELPNSFSLIAINAPKL
jgi:hypothetical protein